MLPMAIALVRVSPHERARRGAGTTREVESAAAGRTNIRVTSFLTP